MMDKQDRKLLTAIIVEALLLVAVSFMGSLPQDVQHSAAGTGVQIVLCVFGALITIVFNRALRLYHNRALTICSDVLAVIGWGCVVLRVVDLPIPAAANFAIRCVGEVLLIILVVAQVMYLRKISRN